jgi:hypothetical protein
MCGRQWPTWGRRPWGREAWIRNPRVVPWWRKSVSYFDAAKTPSKPPWRDLNPIKQCNYSFRDRICMINTFCFCDEAQKANRCAHVRRRKQTVWCVCVTFYFCTQLIFYYSKEYGVVLTGKAGLLGYAEDAFVVRVRCVRSLSCVAQRVAIALA